MLRSGWVVMEEGRGWRVREELVDDVGVGVDREVGWGDVEEWVNGDGEWTIRRRGGW